MSAYDVAVVGAGPAGCTAAHRLATAGLRVALLEKEQLPRYKTCGGGLVPRAVSLLPGDVAPVVERHCHRAEMHLVDAGLRFGAERPTFLIMMAMRDQLDAHLAAAAARAGAELLAPCRVTAVAAAGDRVTLGTTRGSITARFVIAADGATGTVARAAGWTPNPGAVPALEYELVVPPAVFARFAGAARFDFGLVPHGYAWVFPKRERLSVGALSTRRGSGGPGLRASLAAYLRRLGITEILEEERHGYVVPLRPVSAPFLRNRTLVAGDAAGFADPITAEGISFAALSGALAAEAILEGRLEVDPVRRAYERRLEDQILGELRFARFIARMLYDHPRARAAVFRHFGGQLAAAVASAMCGETTYRTALRRPANYLRLLRRAR